MAAEIIPVTGAHVRELLSGVRPEDVAEFLASSNASPAQCIYMGVRHGHESWTGLVNGEVVCIFGVSSYSILGQTGTAWMVGHHRLDRYARSFIKECHPQLKYLLCRYRHLSNWVDARNARAIRWLRWMGFEIHPPVPHGSAGLPFHYFEMNRDV